ncbi:MAG: molybdopterin-dependent oxidoreductase, partial [Actinobacteria bacterium]|nr:molybdopterin-dependent oxidoreductase [Actinomycetota bacterium]
MERAYRTCPLCEAHCGLEIVVDRSAGRVVTIRGDREDPFSRGYLCPKAYGLKGLQEDPDRLVRPLVRDGEGWTEVDWDTALGRAAEGLRQLRDAHGPDCVALYIGNPTVHDMGSLLYLPVLAGALSTRWVFTAASLDQLPKNLACRLMFGGSYTIPVPDVDRTDYLLVLGANPIISNGSLLTAPDMPGRIEKLRARGGKLVVIDPRRSETAVCADEHHFIRPGSDAFLLLAMIRTLFEEGRVCLGTLAERLNGVEQVAGVAREFTAEAAADATGIAPEVIRRLAREFAAAPSAACYGRLGTCTQRFGTLASWAVDVLNALTGNLDRPGGVMFPKPAATIPGLVPDDPDVLPYARWRTRVRGLPEFDGQLPTAALAEEIDTPGEGRVRGLVTLAGNPALSAPNGGRLARALDQLDFVVSIDFYLNETTRFADVILPPTSPLERSNSDLFFYPLSVRDGIHWSPPTLDAPAEARHQWQISLELAARLSGGTVETLEMLHVQRLAGPCGEEAISRAGHLRGPDRLLELLLRRGPYELTLADVDVHGTDLGPLEPRLAEVLTTASGRV